MSRRVRSHISVLVALTLTLFAAQAISPQLAKADVPAYSFAITPTMATFCDSCVYAFDVQLKNGDGTPIDPDTPITDSVIVDSGNFSPHINGHVGPVTVDLSSTGEVLVYIQGPGDGSTADQTVTFTFTLASDNTSTTSFDQYFAPDDGLPTVTGTTVDGAQQIDITPADGAATELWDIAFEASSDTIPVEACNVDTSNPIQIVDPIAGTYNSDAYLMESHSPWWANIGADANGIPKTILISGLQQGCEYTIWVGDYRGQFERARVPYTFTYTGSSTHIIATSKSGNGETSPTSVSVDDGAEQTFTFAPADGYRISSIEVDGVALSNDELAAAIASGYTFTNIVGPHGIYVHYQLIPPTLTVPDLSGLTLDEAETAIESAGFQIGDEIAVTQDATVDNDSYVISGTQSPDSGYQTMDSWTEISFSYYHYVAPQPEQPDPPAQNSDPVITPGSDGGFVAAIPSGATTTSFPSSDALHASFDFGSVSGSASISVVPASNPAPPSATPFQMTSSARILDISISGISGSVTLCVDGDSDQHLFHYTGGAWVDITSGHANSQVCGTTSSFSPFAVAQPTPAPSVAPAPFPSPSQRSSIEKVSTSKLVAGEVTSLTLTGSFPEDILNIDLNGEALSAKSWSQTATTVTISLTAKSVGQYRLNLYNGSLPVLQVQNLSVVASPKQPVPSSVKVAKVKATQIQCFKQGRGVRIIFGYNPTCPTGYVKQ